MNLLLYNQLEMDIMEWFYKIGSPFLDFLFTIFTNLGGSIVIVGLIGITYWCIDKEKGENIAYSVITSMCFNGLLKSTFSRKRPFQEDGKGYLNKKAKSSGASGSSFPSGHSQQAGGLYTSIILNFKKPWVIVLCILAMIIVPISRLYLGVHWPSDVIVGLTLGILTSLLCNYLITKFKAKKHLIYIITLLIFLPFMFFKNVEHDFARAYGLLAGVVGGLIVENKFIGFKNDVPLIKKFLRVLIGALIVGLAYIFVGLIPEKPTNFYLLNTFITIISYALIGFLTIGVVPLLFKNKFNENGI